MTRDDWRTLAPWIFIAVFGTCVALVCGRLLWQFRAALTPWALLIGGAWVFQRTVLRRQP